MSYSISTGTFLKHFDITIKELYVYIHRENIKDNIINQMFLILNFTIIISIITKLSIIFICFILKWIFCDLPKITIKLCKYKCFNLCKECWNNLQYLKKVIKKIYTYNFYSYDREIYGNIIIFIIPIVYISFIISNFIYAIDIRSTEEESSIIFLTVFYLHLFIEIYCSSFHVIKDLMKHFKFTSLVFLLSNINIFGVFIVLSQIENYEITRRFEFYQRIGRLIILLFFIIMYSKSIWNIYNYNMNSKINYIYNK